MPKIRTTNPAGFGGRRYIHPLTLQEVPSVTTILNAVAKPALVGWAAKSVATFAVEHRESWAGLPDDDAIALLKGSPYRKRNSAADSGTDVHSYAEGRLGGLRAAPQCQADRNVDEILDALRPEPIFTEETVWHSREEYAGTFDAIVKVGDEQWLVDWKSGSGVYSETSLQLAAYRYAEGIVTPEGKQLTLPRIDRCVVLHVPKDSAKWAIVPVTADDLEFGVFRSVKALSAWMGGSSPVGQRLRSVPA